MALIVTNKDVPRACEECFLAQLKDETDMGARITYIVDCKGQIVSSWGRRINCPIKDVSEYLDSKRPHSEWIPCTERLPEEDEDVLAWIERDAWKDGSDYPTRKQEFAIGWHIAGRWNFDGYAGNTKCIAWMPLPEPYREEASECECGIEKE